MGQLNNLYVSSSYQGLLKMTDSTNGLTNTLQTVQTGDGDNSPLQMSLTQVNISGSFSVNGIVITGSTSGSSGTSGTSGSNGSSGTSGTSGSSGSGFTFNGAWDNTVTYNLNDVVTYGGQSYVSIQGGNLNKQPSIQPAWWTVFSAAGSSGTSGTSGTSGSSGSSGTSGSSGSSGTSGSSGSSGTSGTSGVAGSSGTSGTSGTSGVAGSSGTSGTSGSSGTSGTAGTSGDSIFALTGSIWETSVQTKFNADSTFGTDLTVLQDINLPTGSAIKLSPDPGGNSAAIRFLSGSNPASNRWLNIQGVPTSPAGDVAISDFPSNNHFMFFEMSGHTIQIEAPLRSTGSAPILIQNGIINNTNYSPVIPGIGLINSGSLTNRGDVDILSNNTSLNVDLYLTSSLLGQSNIVLGWGDNPAAAGAGAIQSNYTGSLRITGSNNIVSLPQLRATGNGGGVDQQGYISGSGNMIMSNNAGIYLNTGSLLFPATRNNIIGVGSAMYMNFTTSSLAGGHPTLNNNILMGGALIANHNSGSLSLTNNTIAGTISTTQNFVTNIRPSIASNGVIGGVTLNHISSSINFLNNYVNATAFNINNFLSSSNITNNSVSVNNNIVFGGSGNSPINIFVSGSQNSNANRIISDSILGGRNITVSSSFVSSSNANIISSLVIGNGLTVNANGTAGVGNNGGTAFLGRFNDTGSLANSQDIVFAVGTGTAAGSRRTGFLIDSGSNTSISGSLNVNGNTTITGSLAVTGNVLFASGSNTTMGTVALNGGNPGTATVSNSLVTANSLIYLTKQTNNHPNAGPVVVSSKGSSTFTITSNHNGDTDTVAYLIINPS